MKVLLVSGIYPPDIGGPAVQTRHIAQGLIRRGHEAHVVTTGEVARTEFRDGVPVTRIAVKQKPGLYRRVRRNARVFCTLNQLLKRFGPDVLHASSGFGALTFWAGLAARWQEVPSIIKYAAGSQKEMTGHYGGDEQLKQRTFKQKADRTLWWNIERATFSFYSCLWATTPRYGKHLIENFDMPREKIWTHPNFINLQPFQKIEKKVAKKEYEFGAPGEFVLLTVARLRPFKGLEECIEMVAQLKDQFPVRLRVAGDGSEAYVAKLRRWAKHLGVADRVDFLGAVPHNRIAEEYQRADLFVLASRHETFGIVLAEAMAAGTPIVATNVGGIPMVVEDGVSARLVPAQDVQRFSDTVRELAKDEGARRSLVQAGRKRAKQFGLEAGLSALMKQYTGIMPREKESLESIEM